MVQVKDKMCEQLEIEGRSLWQHALRRFMNNRAAVSGMFVLGLVVIFLLVAPLCTPFTYEDMDWDAMQASPSVSTRHYFGTDSLGRDLFVRIATGGRISLMVGVASALVAVFFGTIYGALAGYLGERVDAVMMRLVDLLEALPFTFFVILLVTFFGNNILLIFLAIGMVSWLNVARIVRAQTMSLKRKEFIEAARSCGVSSTSIVLRHIIPNALGVVIVYTSLLVPSMILFESVLSFMGLGVREPMASWGGLLQDGARSLEYNLWLLLFPGSFLVVTLLCCNFIGDGLRDALDPRDGSRKI